MKKVLFLLAVVLLGLSSVKAQDVLVYSGVKVYNGQAIDQDCPEPGAQPSYYYWERISGHVYFSHVGPYTAVVTGSGSFVFRYYAVYPSGYTVEATWMCSFTQGGQGGQGNGGGSNDSSDDEDHACPDD